MITTMAQEVTLGGERLGSGSKVKQEMHNYGMNSFNQGRKWRSTMAAGLLYPCFKEIGTTHGTFDIDIETFVRTLPTKGPLFGSFKMQIDLFNVPFRLYQGILHNNPVELGMHMNEVYLPALMYRHKDGATAPKIEGTTADNEQVSTSSLLKYMGISGAGHQANYGNQNKPICRKFQCVPELGYYDIFKNYYSNKQEENAYVVTPGDVTPINLRIDGWKYRLYNSYGQEPDGPTDGSMRQGVPTGSNSPIIELGLIGGTEGYYTTGVQYKFYFNINWSDTDTKKNQILNNIYLTTHYPEDNGEGEDEQTLSYWITNHNAQQKWQIEEGKTVLTIYISGEEIKDYVWDINDHFNSGLIKQDFWLDEIESTIYPESIKLTPFKLKNIDKMRAKLLGNCELGDQVIIDAAAQDDTDTWGYDSGLDETGLPYIANVKTTEEGLSWAAFNQTGLVTKTYQSDMFNNWLDNSLVDTIAQRTKIDTTSGGFTPDTLILQEKIYKYLNRVLVSGGTYYDWQEATYGEGVARMCEIPMYIGGMSAEIEFEEVIANNESYHGDKFQALGSLAGKGTQNKLKGGRNIHVRMDEPGYIIGICSITPRISVFQGNDWDRTELETMDDLHKPELDGIGFQDLMVENMAWWNTILSPDNEPIIVHRDAVGKQTAWLHYQTAVDKVYGDFAKADGYSFMVLSRQYGHDGIFGVEDMTTYIDPIMYNYPFAYQELAAQNFWVSLQFHCTSRRKMGAQQLPTL